jgi:ribosomal 50S subunit-recycling heat shock protein
VIAKHASVRAVSPGKVVKGNGKAVRLGTVENCKLNDEVEVMTNGKTLTLTVDELTEAIRTSIDSQGMPEDQARAMAQHVMNFFGYSERIIDNVLEPEDRDAFYMLEDTGILTTEREETTLYDGREWRIHYWLFRKERIFELISGNGHAAVGLEGIDSVYDDVPDEVWQRAE